jgi:hypothetical protein
VIQEAMPDGNVAEDDITLDEEAALEEAAR